LPYIRTLELNAFRRNHCFPEYALEDICTVSVRQPDKSSGSPSRWPYNVCYSLHTQALSPKVRKKGCACTEKQTKKMALSCIMLDGYGQFKYLFFLLYTSPKSRKRVMTILPKIWTGLKYIQFKQINIWK
jgi:hypothetical protein